METYGDKSYFRRGRVHKKAAEIWTLHPANGESLYFKVLIPFLSFQTLESNIILMSYVTGFQNFSPNGVRCSLIATSHSYFLIWLRVKNPFSLLESLLCMLVQWILLTFWTLEWIFVLNFVGLTVQQSARHAPRIKSNVSTAHNRGEEKPNRCIVHTTRGHHEGHDNRGGFRSTVHSLETSSSASR